jgi:Arc/MetJ-type ribon-helix-helix transcriptional regulator
MRPTLCEKLHAAIEEGNGLGVVSLLRAGAYNNASEAQRKALRDLANSLGNADIMTLLNPTELPQFHAAGIPEPRGLRRLLSANATHAEDAAARKAKRGPRQPGE